MKRGRAGSPRRDDQGRGGAQGARGHPVHPEQKRALVAYAEARHEAIKLANPGRTDGMSESAWFAAERAFRLWRAGPHNFNAPSAANDER